MNRGAALAWQVIIEAGLLMVLPLLFYRPFTDQFRTPKITLTELLVVGGLAVVALVRVWRGPLRRSRLDLPVALLTAAVFLSCLNSPSAGFSLNHARYFLCGPTWLVILGLTATGPRALSRLSIWAVAGGTAVAMVTLAQWMGHDPLLFGNFHLDNQGMVERMNLYSTLGNPNFVAGYLIGAALLALSLGLSAQRPMARAAWFAAFAAMLAAITGTQSHGAWAGMALGSLVWIWMARQRKMNETSRPSRPPLSGVVPISILAAVPMFSNLPARLLNQILGRAYLCRVSWPLFKEHPLLGSGWATFQLRFLELQAQFLAGHSDQLNRWSNITQLHNDLLQLLLEAGLLGLGAFLWLLWRYVQELRQAIVSCDRPTRLILAASAGGVTAVLLDSIFNFQFAVPPTFMLLFTLLAFPTIALRAEECLQTPTQSPMKRASLRVLASVAVLACATILLRQITWTARAELDYAQGMREEALGGEGLQRAEQAYRDALAMDPFNGRIRFGLGRALYLEQRFPDALAETETAGRSYSDSHLEVLKGRIQDALGLRIAALATYRHAVALDPTLKTIQSDIERLQKINSGND
jgi:O-antigen ligase